MTRLDIEAYIDDYGYWKKKNESLKLVSNSCQQILNQLAKNGLKYNPLNASGWSRNQIFLNNGWHRSESNQ